MSKKKKIKTEQDIVRAEQAQKRKAEKIATQKRKDKKSKIITFLVFIICLIVAIVIAGISIGQMYDYETNYEKIDGEITGYIRNHTNNNRKTHISYNLEISYKIGGTIYTFVDSPVFFENVDHLVGKKTQIYVSKENPERAVKVTTADDLSIFSLPFFAVGIVAFVFFAMFCQNYDSTCKKRFLRIWLPIFIACVTFVLLFWIGLPNSNFGVVFKQIDGAIGYVVIACISVLVSIFDWLFSLRGKNKGKQ